MGSNCSNITYPDENLTAFVNEYMGPRCLDPRVAVITVFFYSLIFVLGFFGNLFTCVVIWRNSYLHNATNCYLASLAVSDLISLVLGLPFELRTTLTFMWPDILPESVCKLRSFVTETTSYASVLTITAFSIERWLAICFPLKVKLFSKLNRAIKMIMAIWLTACVAATPIAVFAILNRIPLPKGLAERAANSVETFSAQSTSDGGGGGGSSMADDEISLLRTITDDWSTVKHTDLCALDFNRPRVSSILLSFSFYCFFLLPMLIICVLYAHIGITVRMANKRQQLMNDAMKHDAKKLRRRITVVRMLVAVVVCFFVCWLPFHIQRLTSLYFDVEKMSSEMTQFFHMIFFVSGYFYYANSACNPILYNALNARFRHAFVQTLIVCTRQRKMDSQQQQILEASGCMRSSCSNANALSKMSGGGANGAAGATTGSGGSFLNSSAGGVVRANFDDPHRRISISSTSKIIGRGPSRAGDVAKMTMLNFGCDHPNHNHHHHHPSVSMNSLHAAALSNGRRRSSGCGLLKPPTTPVRSRRKL